MRFTALTTPILLLLLPLLASARGPPACALTCVYKSLDYTSCGKQHDMEKRLGDHLPCLCKDKAFLAAYDNCIVGSGECEGEEVEEGKGCRKYICAGKE